MPTLLLVDDHELVRQGLSRACEREDGLTVVGEAGTVAAAVVAWEELRPDVVVTDLQLPDGSGLDLVREVRARDDSVGLVMVTMHAGDEQIFAAMEAGASAFVSKQAPAREVVAAAKHAARSPRTFASAGLAEAMLRRRTTPPSPELSEREVEVLAQLAEGLGIAAIARCLYVSESTVKSHISRIYQKLGAENRAQALVTAIRRGLLPSVAPRH